jgi:hypothetical protein
MALHWSSEEEETLVEVAVSPLVTRIVSEAGQPLTLAEISQRIEKLQPLDAANPTVTVRGAIGSNYLIASLGGRPARYTWWPRHLDGCIFRQPLAGADPATGELPLTDEVWAALWPDFYRANKVAPEVVLECANGPLLATRVTHLGEGSRAWGLAADGDFAEWSHARGATAQDTLLFTVLDSAAGRFAVRLEKRTERDEPAVRAANQNIADKIEEVLRAGRYHLMLHPDLIPRLIARDAFRGATPPDPLIEVIRQDLRFVIWMGDEIYLAERMVEDLDRNVEVQADPHASPRPGGDWRRATTLEERRAWGAYLFDRGMDHLWVKWDTAAECYYRTALRLDPGHADAWAHLGNLRFGEGRVDEALADYERGEAAALERTVGDPWQYPGTFWDDLDSRPYMRALHGKGLSLWRMGRVAEAQQVFRQTVEMDPDDSQGTGLLLRDLNAGLTWEESIAKEEAMLGELNRRQGD